MAQELLHGILEATIFEVNRISGENCCMCFCKLVDTLEDKTGFAVANSKLYVTIDLGNNANVGKTKLVKNETSNPHWHESFRIYCAHNASKIVFNIKLKSLMHTIELGTAWFLTRKLLDGEEVDKWLHVKSHKRAHGSKIHVKLRFIDVSKDKNWSKGIITRPQFTGVPYTFFPQRNGCRVTLYQDAHVPEEFIPKIPLSEGKYFWPNRCWEDVFNGINNAKHLIYITGWSVYTKITLIRETNNGSDELNLTLGELLIKKANEGVKVLMLVWDERTSVPFLKEDGLMATHDEDTAAFFRNTRVQCVLCPRNPDIGQTMIQDLEVTTLFSHHQKIVVVDSEIRDRVLEKRRAISSFIGGLDLCDGRYDTPCHSIFRTLSTDHSHDFHQPNFRGASIEKGGPREPWHDVHCKLEGPIAWDVLQNFEQRWKKQAGENLIPELRELDDNTFVPPSITVFSNSEANDTWNVQLFRSIDGGSILGLEGEKDHAIDRSIQDAYINAIRRAKSFIYIENQYFLGSSFGWKANKPDEFGASHLIPKELSLKIVSKIKAGERFAVYIVIPIWPEGVPESPSVQAILNWQKMTMEMMYKDIVQALKHKGLEANPRDYLTFFCLGNRETKSCGEYEPEEKPEHGSDYCKAQQSRRFMIYVHSKMMIVDDEYIIIGSANINQRSMDGARDTEIAMGAYQPSAVGPAKGQIHGHRLSLWYEHTKMLDDTFLKPESLECVQKLNRFADKNWDLYSGEALEHDLPGHLLRYPIEVTKNGDVTTLPGAEFFPDTKARILGSKTGLPSILTT